MYRLTSIHQADLPHEAVLAEHASKGAFADCYAVVLPCTVTQADYIEAFYTTSVFKVERWLIASFLSRPSTNAQARQLAQGSLSSFAAWSVEQRLANQLLLAAGRTRSWLMANASPEAGAPCTQLYFGSAVLPRRDGTGRAAMGWQFKALLGFHRLYSRILLGATVNQLLRVHGR
jgi:hypothetical protein